MALNGSTGAGRMPLSESRRRVLNAVATMTPGGDPVTLSDVAAELGGHPNTSRQHLDALADSGLLDVTDIARGTSGRRPHGYTLTEAGRRTLADPHPGGLVDIVSAVSAHHRATGRAASEASDIGEIWGKRTAEAMPEDAADNPGEAVVDMLSMLGFDPAPAPDGHGLLLRNCPLLGAAPDDPEFACKLHEGMVRGVVRRLGGPSTVRLIPFAEQHGCRLSIEG